MLNPNTRQPYAFTGREWEPETGLYYYRARYYSPELQRFISDDPIRFRGGNNFYAYVKNMPSIYRDPFGFYGLPGDTGCGYYEVMCNETGNVYYCDIVSVVCKNFPDLPTNWDECVRQCLQEYDLEKCQPKPCDNPKFSFTCTFVKAHAYFFWKCMRDPNKDPVQ